MGLEASTTDSAPWRLCADIGLLSCGRGAARSLGNQTDVLDTGPPQLVEHAHNLAVRHSLVSLDEYEPPELPVEGGLDGA